MQQKEGEDPSLLLALFNYHTFLSMFLGSGWYTGFCGFLILQEEEERMNLYFSGKEVLLKLNAIKGLESRKHEGLWSCRTSLSSISQHILVFIDDENMQLVDDKKMRHQVKRPRCTMADSCSTMSQSVPSSSKSPPELSDEMLDRVAKRVVTAILKQQKKHQQPPHTHGKK
ncbi:hypothetical protein L6452_19846 [Arctium lappa]|uniref:Uncharacterized protein n=1 Tax=Arctium lappa TaxID=4217 RepID=A0ACB9BB28_ARCLA|nr:hypothetical protein L6452_19846 [Arctium lappa]